NDLYRKETISSFLNYYKNALKSVLSNWDKPLEEIVILNDKEKAEIRFDKNIEPLDEKQNIIEMFERCVEKNPNKIVLHYKEEKLTYLELNSRVNKLAHYLRENNIKKNDIVGIILDKSIEMIVAILGIIKSGAAYLPIDVANPEERIRYIIKDSNVKYVISKDIYSNYIEEDKYIDVYSHVYANYSDENLEIINNIHDLAYVIYTSGSTGMPKGALLKHQNVIAIATESRLIDMTEKDKVLQLSNYAFDVSVAEIMCSLLNGSELFVMDKDAVFNINEVAKYIQDNKITFIFTTTAIFNLIVETNIDSLKYIRRISIGGEKASPYHLNKAFKVIGPNKLLNAYGPTETTVIATGYIINELIDEDKKSRVPIGRGLDYLRTYVLSPDNKLELIGAVGELVIGGLGVAKGYLNKPELTNEKFFQSPFVEGDVLYRTGDLVRLLPDGNIDFLDRIDDQIKIRGYRIEINEIANKIMEHKGVKDVVVVTKTDGNNNNTKLIAYVVLDEEIDVKELKNKLSVELPPYMIPAHFMVIEKIPLTNNGKVDKRNLPEIVEVEKIIDSRPNDDTEALLIEVWSEVLGVDNLSIHDNFFEVGGDSIKAIQVVSKLQKRNKILDVKTIMSIPNIYELSHFVKEKEADFSQEDVEGEILITPLMKEFINEEGRINNHLNQGVILSSENRFNEDNIIKSFDLICRHHDMLRTVWIDGDDKKALYNHNGDAKGYSFEIFNIATNVVDSLERIEKEISKIQKSFDITQLPLFKIALFRCEDEDHLLLIAHHLIIDGISWRIILEDFSEIYMALASEEMVQISKKTSSFKSWAEGLYEYAKSNDINKVIPYWKEILNKNINNKLYKNEFERTLDKVATESVSIDEGTTNKLLHEVNSLYNTETVEILLTALAISFKKTFNNSEFYVNMEGHGREDIQERINVTRTVGWFTSVYPVYLNLSESNTIGKYIIEVKEIMRKIPNKGFDYQILKHISSVKEGEGFNWNQKCQVGFNYLGDYSNTDYGVFTKSNIEITGSFGDDVHQKNPIEINTLIIDGKLKIDISYSKEEISESLMDEFKKEYVNSLKEIIYFCISKDESVFTVSDFDDDSLSEGDLSQILDLFN
ncbi:MAG: amino acid adenylation domain-containing protein, partial [Clostridium sp.]